MIRQYLSLIKFSHTVFALPFALIGLMLGYVHWLEFMSSIPDHPIGLLSHWQKQGMNYFFKTGFLVLLCMVFARSAAMAFNRYLDRRLDALNPRTAIREIPAGMISARGAFVFTVVMSGLFIFSAFLLNPLCFALAPVALLVILGYSYTKRFTPLCHFVLGIGLSLAPIGAYLAVTSYFHLLPVLFSLLVFFWVSGFDIIYALQDEGFDREQGLYSIPVLLGKKRALLLSRFLHLIVVCLIVVIGSYGSFNGWYLTGGLIFFFFLVYQHTLVKPDDLSKVNLAFFTSNGIASVLFFLFMLIELLAHG